MKRKDKQNRIWERNDAEGTWEHGDHVIGCGGKNGAYWMIWAGPQAGYLEFPSLREAMEFCK